MVSDNAAGRLLAGRVARLPMRVGAVIGHGAKSIVAAGSFDGQPVIVKLLTSDEAFWQAKMRHEIQAYQSFAHFPPPVRVPRLVWTDEKRLLVIERLDGQPLDHDRYPQRELPAAGVHAALDTIARLGRWQSPAAQLHMIFGYPERIARYHARGYLTGADRQALLRLLQRCGDQRTFAHGDPLPANLLITTSGECALIDFEFAGLHLPGRDLAMLHALLGTRNPEVKKLIEQHVAEHGIRDAFLVNLACVLTRELRIHHELPDNPLRAARLPGIEADWKQARERLHDAVIG